MKTVFNGSTGKKMLVGILPSKREAKLKAEGHTILDGRYTDDVKIENGRVVADIGLMAEKEKDIADRKKTKKDKRAAAKFLSSTPDSFLNDDGTLKASEVNDFIVNAKAIIKSLV